MLSTAYQRKGLCEESVISWFLVFSSVKGNCGTYVRVLWKIKWDEAPEHNAWHNIGSWSTPVNSVALENEKDLDQKKNNNKKDWRFPEGRELI